MLSTDKISGGNPYLPPEHYVPYTELRIFKDNNETRVYVFGSYASDKYAYGSNCYHVFSADRQSGRLDRPRDKLFDKEWAGNDIFTRRTVCRVLTEGFTVIAVPPTKNPAWQYVTLRMGRSAVCEEYGLIQERRQ